MNPWFAKAVLLAGILGMIAVRAPHIKRSTAIKVVKNHNGGLDGVFVALVTVGLLLPILWIATPVLAFADYEVHAGALVAGTLGIGIGLWVLHRSHVDLGTNWSNTLELRQDHTLVTRGVYRRIRHPMYSALFLHSAGQALVLPNWIAGPSFLAAFTLIFTTRLRREEKMMQDEFGADYTAYMERTKRLVPGIW
jgi:protein-S-isoprenylcysteine O-methyltransferase Ste14